MTNYRYGFNGKEESTEIYGEGNAYDFGARVYDPRLGRWFAVDPLRQIYTSLSPYNFGANNPINIIDADGRILKDMQGNIIATANGKVDIGGNVKTVSFKDGSEIIYEYKYVTIYTDKGNPVVSQLVTKAVQRSAGKDGKMTEKQAPASDVASNCHGYVFAEGKVIIMEGLADIIKDDGYKYLGQDKANSKNADIIVVYNTLGLERITEDNLKNGNIDDGDWEHTAKRENGKSTFTDKDYMSAKRSNLTPEKVKDYNGPTDQRTNLYYKKVSDKNDKKVNVSTGSLKNGVRTVSESDMKKIIKGLEESN